MSSFKIYWNDSFRYTIITSYKTVCFLNDKYKITMVKNIFTQKDREWK